jgi:hypothetical protein
VILLGHLFTGGDLPITVRYFVPAVPLWAVTGAWGIVELARMAWARGDTPSFRAAVLTGVAGALVLSVLGMTAWSHELQTTTRHQWRESAQMVSSEYARGDLIYIMPPHYDNYFRYYFEQGLRRLDASSDPASWCEEGHRVWVVDARDVPPDEVGRQLARECGLLESERFVGSLSVALYANSATEGAVSVLCDGLVPTVMGTAAAEKLNGTAGEDVIVGLGGDDTINALGGGDVVCGGDGNDVINGGSGDDRIFGEAGDDTLNGSAGSDHLDGGPGIDALNAGAGGDVNTCVGGEKLNGC